jgi:stearoyl-CoA desaturase (Delta-9 desaturase)
MKIKKFNTGPALFLIIYQTLLICTLPIYFYFTLPSLGMILASVILLYLTGLSITAGYHRFYSHRAYKTHTSIEFILLFFSSMAAQGSALRWTFDHRLHHAHVDTDEDPYSIKKGFWYAHFLWILEKPRPIESKVVPDLISNKLVMFQHRHYHYCVVGTNGIVFLFMGWLFNDYVGAFFIATWTRLFVLHHFTWFINSLAHTWGDKPFCQEQSAVNNFVISLLTFGEGYHNYHHTFANDYRNGIRWYHFDPTKWLIWILNKAGLAWGLKRMNTLTIKKKLVMERKNLLLERIRDIWYVKKDELENKIQEISDRIVVEISEMHQLLEQYYAVKRKSKEAESLMELRQRIKTLKKAIRQDWKEWVILSKSILNLQPIFVR